MVASFEITQMWTATSDRRRRCISEIVDEKRALLVGETGEEEGGRNYFFSVLPAIFVCTVLQGVTDLWPVRGTANRLFLNARKMHSLPSERSRGKWRERERERTRGEGREERETLFCPSSIFLTIFISERNVVPGSRKLSALLECVLQI